MKRPLSASRFLTLALAAVVAAGLSGCGAKLNVVQTFTIPQDDQVAKTYIMPAQAVEQTVKVDVNVKSGSNVDVFIIPANLVGENIGLSPNEKKEWESKGFGSKKDLKTGTVTGKVPAKTEFKVLIIQSDNAKEKSQVDIKITN